MTTQEKNRASLAYCLTQWKRVGGGSIPQSEEGIAEHQSLVVDYEAIYGPANPNSLKQYANVYAGIRMGIEAQNENDAVVREYNQREIERKEKAEADRRIREQKMLASQRRREAEQILGLNGDTLPLLELQVERLSRYVTRDADRANQLQGMLDSERYKDSPLRGEIRGNLEDVRERLVDYRERLAKFQEDVAEAEAEMDWAREILGLEKPVEGEPGILTVLTVLTVRFRRKKNGFYHPAGREDRAVLSSAGFRRTMGDAMVITADGRVKAWPNDGAKTITLNGVEIAFEPSGSSLVAQVTGNQLIALVGE